ncbi:MULTISPECIES: SDR family NAD(P)-dependent oxidoreductase [unclassified Exiguobacterium]|uniref:SDR family NAD(P)-dependent oxidoreductase n=1 Tax=unclassified Exiguobacterium TaxID=2644629 RepID=UPI001BEB4821|nr:MULTISPECIES: SDR family NAD(P)-dependent oxidoreductase [unclassified Exiguobacterium]
MKILVTGATDGIGLATARLLIEEGHEVLVHGRNEQKLAAVVREFDSNRVSSYIADLSKSEDVMSFADRLLNEHDSIDVLLRFIVNAIAPYVLTKRLLPLLPVTGRVINVSSAAQARLDYGALQGHSPITDGDAYAQSKLAITMWTYELSKKYPQTFIAVNPKSLLGSKMVKSAYGIDGHNLMIGAKVLRDAVTSDEFEHASGKYYDNDLEQFAEAHPDVYDEEYRQELMETLNSISYL